MNLSTTDAASGGDAQGDTFVSIERAYGSGFNDILTGTDEANLFYGYDGNDTLNGLGGNDHLRGFDGNDTLNGGTGNDYLRGNDGNDTLNGGTGNDTLRGDDGNDILNGGTGTNTLVGGEGNDRFIIASGSESTITDFSEGDIIDLVGIADLSFDTFAEVFDAAEQVGSHVSIDLGTTTIVLNNTLLSDLDANDFDFPDIQPPIDPEPDPMPEPDPHPYDDEPMCGDMFCAAF